jgi:uncharacterized small protein (DUF1192 family)
MDMKDILALMGSKDLTILELQERVGQLEKLVGELEKQLKEKKDVPDQS